MTFIAVEGPDGSGKSTQVERLLEHYGGELVPGCSASPIGRLVRRGLSGEEPLDPVEMQCAYTADRLARDAGIWEMKNAGRCLVADRWTMSALVYGALHLEDKRKAAAHTQWLLRINAPVVSPTVYVVLKASPTTLVLRMAKRDKKPEIYERPELVERVAERYVWVRANAMAPCGGSREFDAEESVDDLFWKVVAWVDRYRPDTERPPAA